MAKHDLAALGRAHGIRWNADWLSFLKRCPDGARVMGGGALPSWPGVTTPGKVPSGADWIDDMAEIVGASDLTKQLAQKRASLHFWDQRLLRHAYPVARTAGGDPIVQVTSGRHAGHILRVGHESWYGFFDQLATLGTQRRAQDDDDEFQDEAGPVLRKLGYKGGAPTTDQVVGVLLHPDFDGATRLARSFRELYAALWRARQPAAAGKAKQAKAGTVSIVALPSSARSISADRERAYAGGLFGQAFMVIAVDGTVTKTPWPTGITRVVGAAGSVYVSDLRGLHASADGGKRFSTVMKGRVRSIARDAHGGLWSVVEKQRDTLMFSKDWRKFTRVSGPSGGLVLFGPGAGGVLGAAFDELFVAVPGKSVRVIATPQRDERIDAALETAKGTLLVGAVSLMRSTNGGKTWRKVPQLGNAGISGLFQTWDDEIIVAMTGKKIWLSRDDGKSFQAVPVKLRDIAWSANELDGKILVVAGSQLVRIAT